MVQLINSIFVHKLEFSQKNVFGIMAAPRALWLNSSFYRELNGNWRKYYSYIVFDRRHATTFNVTQFRVIAKHLVRSFCLNLRTTKVGSRFAISVNLFSLSITTLFMHLINYLGFRLQTKKWKIFVFPKT